MKDGEITLLRELSKPLQEYLKENFDMMCEVRITTHDVNVLRNELGTGIIEDENE